MFEFKEALKRIRNHLAGRAKNITRDEALLHEVIKLIFCSLNIKNKSKELSACDYKEIFNEIKEKYSDIFDKNDELLLDEESIEYFHSEIKNIDLLNSERDPIGDAYEIFIGDSKKGQEGQFFTPRNAIDLLIELADPDLNDKVIDPACGAGGFLLYLILHLKKKYSIEEIRGNLENIVGVDKDNYLSWLAKVHLAGHLQKSSKIHCGDSLEWNFDEEILNGDNYYDFVFSNPPYGASIVAGTEETLMKYDLGHKWSQSRKTGEWSKKKEINLTVSPQVVFIEKCIKLAKNGGKICLVVPESLISSKKYGYVVEYIRKNCMIETVIGMPEELFKTSGKGGTHTKTCLLILKRTTEREETFNNNDVFFAEAKWCGNDSRGRKIPKDDLPMIKENYHTYCANKNELNFSALGYWINSNKIENNILAPRYYDVNLEAQTEKLTPTHELYKMKELIDKGIIEIKTGDEVGRISYGTGVIPFVRTSDISNWEIKIDPKHGLSQEVYSKYSKKQDVKAGDIFMVKDGTYLIGTCALITEYDEKMVYQSHIYKIRVKENNLNLTPHLLLAILSSDYLQNQIKSKRVTQDIIDSLGDRIKDLTIPISKDSKKCFKISNIVKKSIFERIEARELARKARIDVLK